MMNRRSLLLGTTTLLGLAGCGAISSVTTNGTTTLTVNVSTIDNFAQAFMNSIALAADIIPGGQGIASLISIGNSIAADIGLFDQSSSGQVQLQFTTASIPAALNSIFQDAKTLLSGLKTNLTTAVSTQATTLLQSVETLESLLAAMLGATGDVVGPQHMTQAQALQNLQYTQRLSVKKASLKHR